MFNFKGFIFIVYYNWNLHFELAIYLSVGANVLSTQMVDDKNLPEKHLLIPGQIVWTNNNQSVVRQASTEGGRLMG